MGAKVILSGIAPEIAQTVVTIGVDLSRIQTVADLQSGIDVADRLLGYNVTRTQKSVPSQE
jgi:rsbT co-antagonist protein RsbR